MLDRNKDKLLKTLLKATKQNRIKYKINVDGSDCKVSFKHDDIKNITIQLTTKKDKIIPSSISGFGKPRIWVYSQKDKISESINYNKDMKSMLEILKQDIEAEVDRLTKLEEERVGDFLSDISDNIGKDLYRESRLDKILGRKGERKK
jgi:hypothetical protein